MAGETSGFRSLVEQIQSRERPIDGDRRRDAPRARPPKGRPEAEELKPQTKAKARPPHLLRDRWL